MKEVKTFFLHCTSKFKVDLKKRIDLLKVGAGLR